MSVTSNSADRLVGVTRISNGVGFWIVVLLAIVAGAFAFLGHVPDGAAQVPYLGP